MSIPLPQVNLAGVSVGQSGTISFANTGIGAGGISANPALIPDAGTVHIFNESGSGLLFNFLTRGDGFYLPAGGWTDKPIRAGEAGLKWTVLYNLPSPPVTLLLVTYYAPGESIPRVPSLGNSPIGIGGTVNTSSVNTLSNETNSSQTLVIDIGQVGNTLLVTINSDGSFVWSVLQSGTAHQVLKAQTSGNPLQIGKSGDVSEVLGNILLQNNTPLRIKDAGGTARDTLYVDAANDTDIQISNSGNVLRFKDNTGANLGHVGSDGIYIDVGRFHYIVGTLSQLNGGLANCGAGTTIAHGLTVIPDIIVATPVLAQPGSASVGIGGSDSLDFEATVGNGTQIDWLAMKG